ncbi:unnamed protein product [Linum tenue]|uniref:Vta1/callose synthase N-terminal domain-containing protein n=1 Tax=Linum tenue TaxID=586396 RepID=A0AAV0H221_9ROSI|nr:unnamed protein product [Linum tenue]
MAASDYEPAKLLLPYLQRADELQKHEPLVAYYCRLYAIERGLRIPQKDRTKTTNALLVSLMNQLEKDKKAVKLGPEDNYFLEGFAQNLFSKADKQDRAGRADLNTAKTFYAASIFSEIINQFGPLQAELEQKQKYAVWKAADIRKALKEGRTPKPGPPVDDEDLAVPSSGFTNGHDVGQVETSATTMQSSESDPSSQFHDQGSIPHGLNLILTSHMTRSTANILAETSCLRLHLHLHLILVLLGIHKNSIHQRNPPIPSHTTICSRITHHRMIISYSYTNFQSYPSFADTSLPSVPSHHPSYYQQQGSDSTTYSSQSAPTPAAGYHPPPALRSSSDSSRMSSADASIPTSAAAAATYQQDSSYQPPPEKIAEARKAARYAVDASDVPVVVEHLKKALELLTNPSADP